MAKINQDRSAELLKKAEQLEVEKNLLEEEVKDTLGLLKESQEKAHLQATKIETLEEALREAVNDLDEGSPPAGGLKLIDGKYHPQLLAACVGVLRDTMTGGPVRSEKEFIRMASEFTRQAKILYEELMREEEARALQGDVSDTVGA